MNPIEDVARAEAEGFEDLASMDELPAQVVTESKQWASLLFAPEMNPYGPSARVRRLVHRASASAPDLLRHEYEAGEYRLVVTEGRSFMLVTLENSQFDEIETAGRATILARAAALLRVLTQAEEEAVVCPERLGEGISFSTNPQMDPRLLSSWNERIDGGIRDGRLYFVIYKRLPNLVGWLDAYAWLRAGSWRAKMARLPRRILRRRR